MKRILLIVFLIVIFIAFYGFFIEPLLLVTKTRLDYKSRVKPEKPVKIIQISDLHIEKYIFFHDIIIDKIKEEKPDIILYTGDSITKKTNFDDLKKFFSRLTEIAPVYSIWGNWDYYELNKVRLIYNETNVINVDSRTKFIYVNGLEIALKGVQIYHKDNDSTHSKDGLNIYMAHVPNNVDKNKDIYIYADIALAGHTHGGQVYLPFITDKLYEKYRYIRGEYDIGEIRGEHQKDGFILYVNRGLGSWGDLRIFSPPEILIININ